MKKSIGQFLLATVLVIFGVMPFLGQEKEIPFKDKRITLHRENESLGTIFRDLIEIYDVPIGFEESDLGAKHSDYLFEVNLPVTGKEGYRYYMCPQVDGKTVCTQRVFEAKDIKFTINVEVVAQTKERASSLL